MARWWEHSPPTNICGLGSNPGVNAICGLSLLLVLSQCSERFFSGYSGFPLSSKTNISKFQFDQESGRRRTTMWMCYLQIVIYLFILFISSVWQFIQRSLGSARTDKPFIPCTLVALVLCRWEGKLESILLLIPWVKNSLCCECSQTLTETGTLFRPKS